MGKDTGLLEIEPKWHKHAGKHKFYVTQSCEELSEVKAKVTEINIVVIAENSHYLIYERPYFHGGLPDIEKIEGEKWVW